MEAGRPERQAARLASTGGGALDRSLDAQPVTEREQPSVVACGQPARLDRYLRRPLRRGGGSPRPLGPPIVVTAESGVAGGYAWVDEETLVVAGGRRPVGGRARRRGCRAGPDAVDGRAFGPVVSARGEVACAIERDDACDVATVPLGRRRLAGADLARRLRLGSRLGRPTERRSYGRNGICRTCRGTRRGSCAATATARRSCWRVVSNPTVVAARAASPVSRPRASTSRGSTTASSSSTASPCSRGRASGVRGAGVVGRTALVRVVARRRRARVVPQRVGFRPARDRRAGPQVGARAVARLAPRPRVGRRRDRVRSFGRGHARAGRRARRERFRLGARSRAAPSAGSNEPGSSSPGRSCGSRASAAVHGLLWRPANGNGAVTDRRADPRWPDGPGARRLEPAGAVARAAGLRRVAAEPSRFVRLRRDLPQRARRSVGRARCRRCRRRYQARDQGGLGRAQRGSRSWAGVRAASPR